MQEKRYPEAISYYKNATQNAEEIKQTKLSMALGDAYFMDNKFALAEQEYLKSNFENDSLKILRSLKIALAQKRQNLHDKALNTLKTILDNKKDIQLSVFNNVLFRYLDWKLQGSLSQTDIGFLLSKFRTEKNETAKLQLLNYIIKFYSDKKQWNDLIREVTPYTDLPIQSIYNDDFIYYLAVAHYNRQNYENAAFYLEKLINQYPASSFYNDADDLYQRIQDYYYIDQKRAISAMAGILGSIQGNDQGDLQLELGKIYYQDLKDFINARNSFEKAVTSSSKTGEAYLFLGKTFLKLAEKPGETKQTETLYLEKAAQSFTKSVENIKTCSAPDEASWLMVQSSIAVDTVSLSKQKSYLETLIKKYPQSPLKEKWMETLAHNLSFDQRYQADARKYFQQLVEQFPQSKRYSDYLYGYAKLIAESDKEKSLSLFRQLALDFENDPNTPDALQHLANHYENNNQYKEAAILYNNYLQNFYYTDEAEQIEYKLGELNIKAGQYAEAIAVLRREADHPFLKDIVLSEAFLSANVKIRLVYLGMAYARQDEIQKAQDYLQQFLMLSANPDFRDIALIELAQIYEQNNNKSLAAESYRNVGKSDPALYNRARFKLANLLYESQKFSEAENVYNELSSLVTEKPLKEEVDGKLIICKIKNGKISQAEELIKQYKRNFSNADDYFAQFTIEFGDYFRRQKDFDKAIRYFKTVKSNYNKSNQVDDAEYFIALTYITLNRNEDAFDILTKFKANYPNSDRYPFAVNTLGSLYYRVEKYDEAIAAFKSAINLSKDDELSRLAMSNLIKTYQLTGFWDAAQGLARQYLEKYPQAEDRIDKKMVIAQAFINLNQFQNAVEYLKSMKLEADSEKEPEIQFYIGEAYLKAGQYEEAIAEFVKIPLLSKKTKLQWEASALYYSGQAYEKMGRIADAIRMYQEIIDRPGIDMILKRDAERRINQIKG